MVSFGLKFGQVLENRVALGYQVFQEVPPLSLSH